MDGSARPEPKPPRIAALDQFRGYTVAGMFLVNFLSDFNVAWETLRHHDSYASYADTIMPQFFFAAGFAYRLTLLRRSAAEGRPAATRRALRRILGLVFVALLVHAPHQRWGSWAQVESAGLSGLFSEPLKRSWFQTLMHIALVSLWTLPVIRRSAAWRLAWMASSGLLHLGLSYAFNFAWIVSPPVSIDGGPLGFLTWSLPFLAGSLALDLATPTPTTSDMDWQQAGGRNWVGRKNALPSLLGWGAGAMCVGYVLSCGTRLYDMPMEPRTMPGLPTAAGESPSQPVATDAREPHLAPDPVWPSSTRWHPGKWQLGNWGDMLAEPPGCPPRNTHRPWNYWMMSQRWGTLSYQLFSAGWCLALFGLFWLVSDVWNWQSSVLRTLGGNALVAYVLHDAVAGALAGFSVPDAPLWYALLLTSLFFAATFLILRSLERQGLYLRL